MQYIRNADIKYSTYPLTFQKNLLPTFFMEHMLQGLYGVDAPAQRRSLINTECNNYIGRT